MTELVKCFAADQKSRPESGQNIYINRRCSSDGDRAAREPMQSAGSKVGNLQAALISASYHQDKSTCR